MASEPGGHGSGPRLGWCRGSRAVPLPPHWRFCLLLSEANKGSSHKTNQGERSGGGAACCAGCRCVQGAGEACAGEGGRHVCTRVSTHVRAGESACVRAFGTRSRCQPIRGETRPELLLLSWLPALGVLRGGRDTAQGRPGEGAFTRQRARRGSLGPRLAWGCGGGLSRGAEPQGPRLNHGAAIVTVQPAPVTSERGAPLTLGSQVGKLRPGSAEPGSHSWQTQRQALCRSAQSGAVAHLGRSPATSSR